MVTTRQPRGPALNEDLPPVIGVDPGSAATAITVRCGPALLAAAVVLNPEITTERHTLGADPAIGYAARVEAVVRDLADEHADTAREWYGLPAHADPWLIAIEKINPARLPRDPAEAKRFDPVHVAEGSTFAANAVANRLLGTFTGRIVWVIPFHADTRWESRFATSGGTGNPFDFYPAALLAGAIPADTGRTYPDYYFDRPEHRASRTKDLLAAWSIASDAAQDFERVCETTYGTLLPPSLAPLAVPKACPPPLNGRVGTPRVITVDVGTQPPLADQRYQAAKARLTARLDGRTASKGAVLRDLRTIATYKREDLSYVIDQWAAFLIPGVDPTDPDLNLPQVVVDRLRFVNTIKTAAASASAVAATAPAA